MHIISDMKIIPRDLERAIECRVYSIDNRNFRGLGKILNTLSVNLTENVKKYFNGKEEALRITYLK